MQQLSPVGSTQESEEYTWRPERELLGSTLVECQEHEHEINERQFQICKVVARPRLPKLDLKASNTEENKDSFDLLILESERLRS